MAAAALVGGKHVLVDKPMAVNAAEGERMLAAASAHSKQVSLGTWRKLVLNRMQHLGHSPLDIPCSRRMQQDDAAVAHQHELQCVRLSTHDILHPAEAVNHLPPVQVAIVDHELRFVPAFQRARELLLDGAIGAVLGMESTAILVRLLRCCLSEGPVSGGRRRRTCCPLNRLLASHTRVCAWAVVDGVTRRLWC